MTTPPELRSLVDRTIWWEPARSRARADLEFFLPYAMAYASAEVLAELRRHVSDERMRAALRAAPPGLFDVQSWRYWHAVLGVEPVPPRPRRPFIPAGVEPDDTFSKCVERTLAT